MNLLTSETGEALTLIQCLDNMQKISASFGGYAGNTPNKHLPKIVKWFSQPFSHDMLRTNTANNRL